MNFKRFAAALSVALLLAAGLAQPASASPSCGHNLDGYGDLNYPWQINNENDFLCLREATYFTQSETFISLRDNIHLTSSTWPAGPGIRSDLSHVNFNGGGYTITISGMDWQRGLFQSDSSAQATYLTVSHLTIHADTGAALQLNTAWLITYVGHGTFDDVHIEADADCTYCAGIATYASNDTLVTNSSMTGVIADRAGGLIGPYSSDITIQNSYSTGAIGIEAGGLVGMHSNNISIAHSHSTGEIGNTSGGLVGPYADGVEISASYSTGAVGESAGGLIGEKSKHLRVNASYSTGNLNIGAGGIVGALVGNWAVGNPNDLTNAQNDTNEYAYISNCYSTGQIGNSAGGIVGSSALGVRIINSFSTGDLTGQYAGGLLGASNFHSTIQNSYTTGNLIGNATGGIVAGEAVSFIGTNLYSSGLGSFDSFSMPTNRGIYSETPNGQLDNYSGGSVTIANSYSEQMHGNSGVLSLVNAQAYLIWQVDGVEIWGYCESATPSPIYLKAFNENGSDPCSQPCTGSSCNNSSGGSTSNSDKSTTCKAGITVHFLGGTAQLSNSDKKRLKKFAKKIKRSHCKTIVLKAYSSNSHFWRQDPVGVRISHQRARTVAQKLKNDLHLIGYSAKFKVKWYGSKDPIASNKTYSGRSKNRRVVIAAS